jgi:hypothetical protein
MGELHLRLLTRPLGAGLLLLLAAVRLLAASRLGGTFALLTEGVAARGLALVDRTLALLAEGVLAGTGVLLVSPLLGLPLGLALLAHFLLLEKFLMGAPPTSHATRGRASRAGRPYDYSGDGVRKTRRGPNFG